MCQVSLGPEKLVVNKSDTRPPLMKFSLVENILKK